MAPQEDRADEEYGPSVWRNFVLGEIFPEVPTVIDCVDDKPRRLATSHLERITSDPSIFGGRPCIRGMRVRVKDIIDLLASGASRAEILADYPYLEDDDIGAALEYAAQ
jgi:uncharacterized protein (DUF433 family)